MIYQLVKEFRSLALNKNLLLMMFVVFTLVLQACKSENNKLQQKEQFIDDLVSKMTLEEKLGQLNLVTAGEIITGQALSSDVADKIKAGQVGGLFNIKSVSRIREIQKIAVEQSRLKIPLLFGMDVIHGYETTFPIPLALSCSWDTSLIKQTAKTAAQEASSKGINWTFSPMVDISRDPRWGRVAEGSGEDPFLGGLVAEAMVKGYQGKELNNSNTILSCVKHFALYGAAEAGRDYNTVDMSPNRMFNEYFPPFKKAIEAGVGSLMTSFNDINGVPATGNKWLLTDVLRNQWKFKGFVVSDYTGINEMMAHGIGNLQDVATLAFIAGVTMDMVGEGFVSTLPKSLNENKINITQINNAVKLILSAKYDLGLFDNPYLYCSEECENQVIFTKENRLLARHAAVESMVLLKNENRLLPLKPNGTVAVIGPLAASKENMAGTWSVATDLSQCASLLDGIRNNYSDSLEILYAKGSNLAYDSVFEKNSTLFGRSLKRDSRTDDELLQEALAMARKSDVIIAALGESSEMSGESSSRASIRIPDSQKNLLNELVKLNKPIVLVVFAGRPLVLSDEIRTVPAILYAWFGGTETGNAIADIIFGRFVPSAKITMSFPYHEGQIPIYYNHKNTGRPLESNNGQFEKFKSNYLDIPNSPLFPFGFGLSYTDFHYDNLRLSKDTISSEDTLSISIDITNIGEYDAKEIVQLYIRDMQASITRPVKELKSFQKILLNKGESKNVIFKLTIDDLKFYNNDLKFVAEPGNFEVFVGKNSAEGVKSGFYLSKH